MAKSLAKLMANARVRTGLVRFSFVHVFAPQQMDDGSENYNLVILIDKNDKETIDVIYKAIAEAKDRGLAELWANKLPKKMGDGPLHDGEEKEDIEGFDGCLYMNCKSKRKPKLVDKNLDPILDEEEFYSGCYGSVTLSFWPYKSNGNNGVGVSLDSIVKIKDGERLGGSVANPEEDYADADFSAYDEDDDL